MSAQVVPSRAAPRVPGAYNANVSGGVDATSPVPYTPQGQFLREGSAEPGSGGGGSGAFGGGGGGSMADVYEHQGLSSTAMQASVLSAKVATLQSENQKARRELKEAMDKLSTTSAKLNEQKIQNSALMHKYSAAMEKLSAAEEGVKGLEDNLASERRAHHATHEGLEQLREQLRERDGEIASLRQAVAAERARADRSAQEASSQPAITAATIRTIEARCQDQCSELVADFERCLDRLLTAPGEDDTAIFVARSAVLSAATDLDTKLANTQNLLQNTIAIFNDFSRTMEDETSRMLLSLMTENKELWMSLNKTQFELDKAQAELAQARTRSGVGLNEHEYLQQQIAVLEQNIAAAHTTIEEQTKAQQRAEDALRRMVDEHQIAKQRGDQLQAELDAALAALEEREREWKEASFESEQALQQAREVQKLNEHQSRQITSLTEQLHTLQETYGAELRSSVRSAQADRDAAIEACNKLRGELEDALARLASTERELESRTAFFNNFKVTTEENHAQYIRSLQDDIAHHKALYERELEDMRRELQEKSDEVYAAMKEAEAERTGRLEAAAALRALDEQAATLSHERTAATEALRKSEERAADLQASLDQLRDSLALANTKSKEYSALEARHKRATEQLQASLEDERQRHAAAVSKLEASWRETENSRTLLQEEVRKLRQRAMDEQALRQARDRFERDKEQLMAENVRLHQEYQDVQQQNVNLQATIAQLQSRSSAAAHFQEQVDDLQRRMAELPALRQQADECQREAYRAREEAEALRAERDEMSARLEYFLEASRVAAVKDEQKDRVLREASSQARRLHQRVEEVSLQAGSQQQQQQPRASSAGASARGRPGGPTASNATTTSTTTYTRRYAQQLDLQPPGASAGNSPAKSVSGIDKMPFRV